MTPICGLTQAGEGSRFKRSLIALSVIQFKGRGEKGGRSSYCGRLSSRPKHRAGSHRLRMKLAPPSCATTPGMNAAFSGIIRTIMPSTSSGSVLRRFERRDQRAIRCVARRRHPLAFELHQRGARWAAAARRATAAHRASPWTRATDQSPRRAHALKIRAPRIRRA